MRQPRRPNSSGHGRSTPMRSEPLELGKYVIARKRRDGSHRVLFEVPARLRPSGWSPTTTLPLSGRRRGDLTDADEVARIQKDAKELYARFLAARGEAPEPAPDPDARRIATLITDWRGSQAWKDNRPRTNKGYEHSIREIEAWVEVYAEQTGAEPDPATLTPQDVEVLLALFDDRPTTRYHVRKAFRMVMQQAVKRHWRADNPVTEVKVPIPETTVDIWEASDVEEYATGAVQAGQPDLAAIIYTEWEIGQRITDVILFRYASKDQGKAGEGYDPQAGAFRFWQSKTKSYVTVRVSDRCRAAIARCRREDSFYLFHDAKTGRPFRDVDRLSHLFEEARASARAANPDLRHLLLKNLRHSCIVQLGRASCEVAEIKSVTGHSAASINKMLSIYLPRDSVAAEQAQMKRGLVERVA